MKKFYMSSLSIAVLALIGCNDGSTTMNQQLEPLKAQDALIPVNPSLNKVDLGKYVSQDATIVDVVSDDNACSSPTINGTVLTFNNDNNNICKYEYTAERVADKQQDRAKLVTVKSATGIVNLPAKSYAVSIDEEVELDIKTLLGSEYPSGYTLGSKFMEIGSNNISIAGDKIKYKGEVEGFNRLIYTLEGSVGGVTDVKLGVLTFNVSGSSNTPPFFNNFIYNNIVAPSEEITLDLSPYLSDADGDDIQLVDVYSLDANASLSDPSDSSNHGIKFSADKSGYYFINVVITDGNGGFNTGIIAINVSVDTSTVEPWNDIWFGSSLFTAPITEEKAHSSNTEFNAVFFDNDHAVVGFNFETATQSCLSSGSLPTSSELAAMFKESKTNWPNDRSYWTLDKKVVSTEGLISEPENNGIYYVSCLSDGFTVQSRSEEFYANGSDYAYIDVNVKSNSVDGVLGKQLTLEILREFDETLEEPIVIVNDTATTDSDGHAVFKLQSTVAEKDIRISVTDDKNNVRYDTFSFIGDNETSTLDEANFEPNGKGTVKVTDSNGNPVQGETINISVDNRDVSVDKDSVISDEMGIARFKLNKPDSIPASQAVIISKKGDDATLHSVSSYKGVLGLGGVNKISHTDTYGKDGYVIHRYSVASSGLVRRDVIEKILEANTLPLSNKYEYVDINGVEYLNAPKMTNNQMASICNAVSSSLGTIRAVDILRNAGYSTNIAWGYGGRHFNDVKKLANVINNEVGMENNVIARQLDKATPFDYPVHTSYFAHNSSAHPEIAVIDPRSKNYGVQQPATALGLVSCSATAHTRTKGQNTLDVPATHYHKY
ncbi:hypothetical protein ACWU37_20365 [Photobacterium damselae subsp. damselae]|uniref:hypothetical protein n=1 Tax=Photobacterium damselae TaxID=38293 RepID=UPI003C6DD3B7